MGGGLRVDPRELPPGMQEQVATKILAQISSRSVAVQEERSRPAKVPVRALRLTNQRNINRYRMLKDAVKEGVISNLKIKVDNNGIWGFSYKIQWCGEFVPTGIPFKTLQSWACFTRQLGKGFEIVEPIIREARE